MKINQIAKISIIFVGISLFPSTILASSKTLSPLPNFIEKEWKSLNIVGQTTLKKFGFHVYDATFWVNNHQGDKFSSDMIETSICALSITYARKIKAKHLLSNTKKEWQRLGIADHYQTDAWLKILSNIWPNVDKGDQLIFIKTNDGKNVFYSKEKILGTIDDPNFGTAFLSIWLDEKSKFKRNRKELIGETK